MGTSAALRMVPDEVILTISRLGVLQRLPDILPHDEVIDGIPKHTAGVDGVDVVHIADDGIGPAGKQRVCHGVVLAAVHAEELAGLGVDDGIGQLAAFVGVAEEIRRDAVVAVHLDDAVAQQGRSRSAGPSRRWTPPSAG